MLAMPLTRRNFMIGASAAVGALMLPQHDARAHIATPRVALVGCGRRGHWHANRLSSQIVAVCDPAAGARRRFSVPHLSWEAILDSPDIDSLIVAAPESVRASLICDALLADKHVRTESPIAMTPEQCNRVAQAVRDANATLIPVCHSPFTAHATVAATLIHEGTLSPVRRIYSRLPSAAFPTEAEPSHASWRHARGQSMGPAFEALHHQIAALAPLLTYPLSLASVAGGRFATPGNTPDALLVEFTDAKGIQCTISTSPDAASGYISARSETGELAADARSIRFQTHAGDWKAVPVASPNPPFDDLGSEIHLEIARFIVAASERLASNLQQPNEKAYL